MQKKFTVFDDGHFSGPNYDFVPVSSLHLRPSCGGSVHTIAACRVAEERKKKTKK